MLRSLIAFALALAGCPSTTAPAIDGGGGTTDAPDDSAPNDSGGASLGCGDGTCAPTEACGTCPSDCGSCGAVSPSAVTVELGEPELVLDPRGTCALPPDVAGWDLPDVYAHALRTPDGIVLISGNAPWNFVSVGPDFGSLARDCDPPAFVSRDLPTAESYANQEWITSVWTEDGIEVFGLVHNEFHDPIAPTCLPGDTSPANPCWYNSISLVRSGDGGRTFEAASPASHLVAAPPLQWEPPAAVACTTDADCPGRSGCNLRRGVCSVAPSPYGYIEPSNMVRAPDGYFYSVVFAITSPTDQGVSGSCLMRTNDLTQPDSWRFWDGSGFGIDPRSPYDVGETTSPCAFLPGLEGLRGSLTWNTYLDAWLLVGAQARQPGADVLCGFWFATSPDLINWSSPGMLVEGQLPFPPCTDTDAGYLADVYPSIIDHDDTTPSFERSGQSPYLYFTRWVEGVNRSLFRREITFHR
jgi:hypothetical protein